MSTIHIDFNRIEDLFRNSRSGVLLEHEVYTLLNAAGIATPAFLFLEKGESVREQDLARFSGSRVVLKVVSPDIAHKSDVGGVRFAAREALAVNREIAAMLEEIPRRFPLWAGELDPNDPARKLKEADVAAGIRGVLICRMVEGDGRGLGNELLLGMRLNREFGPVITLGGGGLDVEFLNRRLRPGTAAAIASAHLAGEADIPELMVPLAFYDKITQPFRGHPALLASGALAETVERFRRLAARFSPFTEESEWIIEEAEINPLVIESGRLTALDGLCRFAPADGREAPAAPRKGKGLQHLLRPGSLSIIGVSEKMNIGHIILNNVLSAGFPRDRITVIKPGAKKIEGCRCVAAPADLPEAVDLFVLAVGAEQSEGVLRELVEHEKARSVILIPGGIGEKRGTDDLAGGLRALLADGRREGRLTPVVNGGNCLGVSSRPGRYNTIFVPPHKIYPRPGRDRRAAPLVFISQSGAFMISRLSCMPGLEPLYAVSIGNQLDLTVSDYLVHLADDPEARVFAVYLEGFQPGDGLAFAGAAAGIASQPGKSVVVYKAGRSPEGRAATAGHTASVAGDYPVARSVLRQAGAYVVETIAEFEDTVRALCLLGGRRPAGRRVGLISNAGFECVIMSDSLGEGRERLRLARWSQATAARIEAALHPLGIDRLQDVRNPLDITPVADDATFAEAAAAVLADPGVDAAVLSPLPMSAALNSLETAGHHGEDLTRRGALGPRLVELVGGTHKPCLVCLDAGGNYDPLAAYLEAAEVPVFRRSDDALAFLRRFIEHNLGPDLHK